MYLGIDIGGTKTLIARMDDHGVIIESEKCVTPQKYSDFLKLLTSTNFIHHDYRAIGLGAPGIINRQTDIVEIFSNLEWKNVPLCKDVETIFKAPTFVENDAKLAGLSESMLVKDKFPKVLYITISTGIGYSLVDHTNIDPLVGDTGGRSLIFNKNGKYIPWEDQISGRAIVKRFGKMAKDIDDPEIWKSIARDLGIGIIELIAIFEPNIIIFGGSVGNYFSKYKESLKKELTKYHLPLIEMPILKQAERPDFAVIYGCYDYAKQKTSHARLS